MSAPSPAPTPLRRIGWLAGLPLLALLWAGATLVTEPVVTDSLKEAASAVTREAGAGGPEPWLRVEIDGRDLLALGEAPEAAARDSALARLAAIPGLRRLADETGLIEAASPFVWTATRVSPESIEIAGSRPAETGAGALAARLVGALPPGARLHDRARAARGAPPDFAAAAIDLAGRLRGLAPGAVASLSDTVLSVRGEAIDPAAYEASRAGAPQGFSLGAIEILPPLAEDFRLVVERRPDGGIALSGHVVSETARAGIRAAADALASDAAVADTMRTARGLPDPVDAGALAKAVLRLAGLVRDGAVRYEGGALSVSGDAIDGEAVGEAEALMREARPEGVAAGAVALVARPVSPYRVRIRREADSVTLTGHLPDRATRESLLAGLRPRLFRESLTDRTRLSAGAPPQLAAALVAAFGPLSNLASGELSVSDRTLRLSGESLYAESARRLPESLPRAMPDGWETSVAVTLRDAKPAPDAGSCARLFSERTAGRVLRFAPGSAELRPDFYAVLDAVAELARTCPSQHVEVVGHADPPGAPAAKLAPLPEFKAAQEKAREERKAQEERKAKEAKKSKDDKKGRKPEPERAEAPAEPEPEPDLPRARALAIVDYLLKAGVAPGRALAVPDAAPLGERQGVALRLRS